MMPSARKKMAARGLLDASGGEVVRATEPQSLSFDSILDGLKSGRYWVKMSPHDQGLHPQYSLVTGRAIASMKAAWKQRQIDEELFAPQKTKPGGRPRRSRKPAIENPYAFRQWCQLSDVQRETVKDAILLREIGPGGDASRAEGQGFRSKVTNRPIEIVLQFTRTGGLASEQGLGFHPTVTNLPNEFSLRFTRIRGLTSDLAETKKLLKDFLEVLRKDGVRYVELMVDPLGRVAQDLKSVASVFGKGSDAYDVLSRRLHDTPSEFDLLSAEFYLRKLIDATFEYNAAARQANDDTPYRPREVDARFLLGMNRTVPLRTENITNCLALVRKFKDYPERKYHDRVIGINLVADEFGKVGRPSDFFRTLVPGGSGSDGLSDAISLHAGESVADDGHPLDSMLMGARRLGHGLSLKFSPRASALVRQRKLCIEACPLSNKFLGFYPDLEHHPAREWVRRGYRVCLNTDDPGIFDTTLTHDFYFATLAFKLSLRQIRELCRESLRSSFADASTRKHHLKEFNQAFDAYVKGFTV